MELIVNYLGNVRFEAVARGHRVVSDQPPEMKGSDQGMTPPELLLASLGTCAGYYAAEYLRTRSLPSDGLQIKVTAEKVKAPARLEAFKIEVTLPGLDPQHEAGLLRAVKFCLIHNTLLHTPAIEITLRA
jgi:uncharacterized OsmC-like protein